MAEGSCFGFYTGEFKCREAGCRLAAQCKALVNTDGLDVASDVIDTLLDELPDQPFCPTESVRALLAQLLHPETAVQALKLNTPPPVRTPSIFGPVGPDPF